MEDYTVGFVASRPEALVSHVRYASQVIQTLLAMCLQSGSHRPFMVIHVNSKKQLPEYACPPPGSTKSSSRWPTTQNCRLQVCYTKVEL